MRNILNISLPAEMATELREAASGGQYTSVSEFVRSIVRDWMESRELSKLKEGEAEIRAGRGKTLKSLKSLR